jgi:teichuronic acid biosynthesis glycosyltransferase TuaH
MDVSHALRTGNEESLKRPWLSRHPDFEGLTLLNPLKLLPNSIALGRAINARTLASQVKKAARRARLVNPLLWINDHFAGTLVGKVGERAVVYDITDDWTLMGAIPVQERRLVRKADAELCSKADLVVVCSEALEKTRKNACRRLVRVPNGVDVEHYKLCHKTEKVGAPGAPVFGYLGTLHGERLDFQLIEALANRRPNSKIILCGPNMLQEYERHQLSSLSNVEVRPPVDYRDVPAVLSSFDVCILPHRKTPFTESLNPIKLWEYLATGKPIAATSVAGFRDFHEVCHLGDGAAGFVAACDAASKESGVAAGSRIRLAEANSWKRRVDDLTEVFRQESWLGVQKTKVIPAPSAAAAKVSAANVVTNHVVAMNTSSVCLRSDANEVQALVASSAGITE